MQSILKWKCIHFFFGFSLSALLISFVFLSFSFERRAVYMLYSNLSFSLCISTQQTIFIKSLLKQIINANETYKIEKNITRQLEILSRKETNWCVSKEKGEYVLYQLQSRKKDRQLQFGSLTYYKWKQSEPLISQKWSFMLKLKKLKYQ